MPNELMFSNAATCSIVAGGMAADLTRGSCKRAALVRAVRNCICGAGGTTESSIRLTSEAFTCCPGGKKHPLSTKYVRG